MDVSSAFKTEVFRPLVTIVVPGTVAIFPALVWLNNKIPTLAEYRDSHEPVYFTGVVMAALATGLVLEDIGSRIETIWDWILSRGDESFEAEWYSYLCMTFKTEPIGQRYLRTILLRMKFELSFAIALFVFALTMWKANAVTAWFSAWHVGVGTVLVVGLAFYLLWESYTGALLLARLRRELIKSCKPTEGPQSP